MADILPFPPWQPDLSSYKGASSQTIKNVLPRGDGYGPAKQFQALTATLPTRDGNDSFTKVLLHFTGSDGGTVITDSNTGGSAHTWTANGNANTDTAQTKFGSTSLACDGTGDYVTTPDSTDFTLGSGDWTIDCWFNVGGGAGAARVLCGQSDSSATSTTRTAELNLSATNVLTGLAFIGAAQTAVIGTTTITTTGWHHAAFVRTGNVLKLFLDGVQEGGNQAFVGTVNNSSNAYSVGRLGEFTTITWNGWIDEFRLSVGVARWTAAFTPPTYAYSVVISPICRGHFCARNSDGTVTIFAGTAADLYKLNNNTLLWEDVSAGQVSYSTLPATFHWQFAQFGSIVIAVKPSTAPQAFTLASSTEFAALAGSPPQAAYIAIVGRFVVLSGLTSTPFRIQWSALGSAIGWTQGVDSSDSQDLPDGGIVRGVSGGEYGVIFQETAMRRMIFAPGSPVIFTIEKIADDKGLLAPYSLIRAGEKIFWLAAQGFQGMTPTGLPESIGKEKFDRFFFENYDSGSMQLVIGAADPESTRVFWSFRSSSGSASAFNFILCYDYGLGRPSLIEQSGEYLASLAAPGITLENLDSISSSLDALTVSLDDISTAALTKLSIASSDHQIGFFSGANREATLDTSEQAGSRRFRVKGFRPITDAATCYGSVGARETSQAAITYSTEQVVNGRGLCPANISTRLARGRLRIPASTAWTFVTGLEPMFSAEGQR